MRISHATGKGPTQNPVIRARAAKDVPERAQLSDRLYHDARLVPRQVRLHPLVLHPVGVVGLVARGGGYLHLGHLDTVAWLRPPLQK